MRIPRFVLNRCNFFIFLKLSKKRTFLKFLSHFCRYQHWKHTWGPKRDLWDIQYIVVAVIRSKIRIFSAEVCSMKVNRMSNIGSNDCFQDEGNQGVPLGEGLSADDDLLMEQILDNMNTTPIGLVLKKIASLPECRRKRVLEVRRQLTDGEYDLNERLDVVLERVLEDLSA